MTIEDKILILKMNYDTVVALNDRFIKCTLGNKTIILDEHGTELISGESHYLNCVGTYIIIKENDKLQLYNIDTNTKKSLDCFGKTYTEIQNTSNNEFLMLSTYSLCILLNKNLEQVLKLNNISYRTKLEENSKGVVVKYCTFTHLNTAFIRYGSTKPEYYDKIKLDNTPIELIATSKCDEKVGFSINKDVEECFKYKLSNNGVPLTEKEYQDILKPAQLKNTPYLYTYDTKENRTVIGVITEDGKELLHCDYCDIEYIGSENFIVSYASLMDKDIVTGIYNVNKGMIVDFNQAYSIEMHSSLPVAIIKFINNNKLDIMLLKTTGEYFNMVDLAKYFKCSYYNDIIRVDLGYTIKYIDTHLTPINNIHDIINVKNVKWTNM